jgi:hypothetical protein
MDNYKYKYTIRDNIETLLIMKSDKIISKERYIDGYCLYDLILNQNLIPIDETTKVRVKLFLAKYIIYLDTKRYDLIDDIIIQCSSKNMTIGIIPPSHIPVSFQTQDIEKLVDFMIVYIFKHELPVFP